MKKLFAIVFVAGIMLAVGTQAFAQISVTGSNFPSDATLGQTMFYACIGFSL